MWRLMCHLFFVFSTLIIAYLDTIFWNFRLFYNFNIGQLIETCVFKKAGNSFLPLKELRIAIKRK